MECSGSVKKQKVAMLPLDLLAHGILKAPVLDLKIYPLVLYTLCQLVRHKQHFYGNLISIS